MAYKQINGIWYREDGEELKIVDGDNALASGTLASDDRYFNCYWCHTMTFRTKWVAYGFAFGQVEEFCCRMCAVSHIKEMHSTVAFCLKCDKVQNWTPRSVVDNNGAVYTRHVYLACDEEHEDMYLLRETESAWKTLIDMVIHDHVVLEKGDVVSKCAIEWMRSYGCGIDCTVYNNDRFYTKEVLEEYTSRWYKFMEQLDHGVVGQRLVTATRFFTNSPPPSSGGDDNTTRTKMNWREPQSTQLLASPSTVTNPQSGHVTPEETS